MINSLFFLGEPVEFNGICKVYPPTIKEIIKTSMFPLYEKILTQSQEDIEDIVWRKYFKEYKDPSPEEVEDLLSPFEYLLNLCFHEKDFEMLVKDAFYFFIHEEITFLYKEKLIIVGNLKAQLKTIKSVEELRMLNENNFFSFQNLIRDAMGEKIVKPPIKDEDFKIKRIKAKGRYRDSVKNSKGGLNLVSLMAIICCMNFGLNPLNIGEVSYCSAKMLSTYYQYKQKHDIDISALLAGAKLSPEEWIKNIED